MVCMTGVMNQQLPMTRVALVANTEQTGVYWERQIRLATHLHCPWSSENERDLCLLAAEREAHMGERHLLVLILLT